MLKVNGLITNAMVILFPHMSKSHESFMTITFSVICDDFHQINWSRRNHSDLFEYSLKSMNR